MLFVCIPINNFKVLNFYLRMALWIFFSFSLFQVTSSSAWTIIFIGLIAIKKLTRWIDYTLLNNLFKNQSTSNSKVIMNEYLIVNLILQIIR